MAIIIRIPTILRKLTAGQEEVHGRGETIVEVLQNLERDFPGFQERLFDGQGTLRKFINIYLNDQDIRFLNNLGTPVPEGSTISLIPAIAGGAPGKNYEEILAHLSPAPYSKAYDLPGGQKVFSNYLHSAIQCFRRIWLSRPGIGGEEKEIEKVIKYLQKLSIKVEFIEKDIIE